MDTQQVENKPSRFADIAIEAMGTTRLVAIGLLACLAAVLGFSFWIAYSTGVEKESVAFVLSFFKDVGLILVGALANSVSQKKGN